MVTAPLSLKVAWLLTSSFFYWHPPMAALARRFPQFRAFTANWPGYAKGYEQSFVVEVVGDRKVIPLIPSKTSYGVNFTYLPLNIIGKLRQFGAEVIFSNSFGLWTILTLVAKGWCGWRVVVAYEGSSPGVDYRHSVVRLALRRWLGKKADALITNTQGGKRYLTEILGLDPQKIFVHPYEVPDRQALLKEKDNPGVNLSPLARPIFLAIGTVNRRKNLQTLLTATKILQDQGITNFTVAIVGDGDQKPALEAYGQTHGLQQVQWLGRVPYEVMGAYLNQGDVLVLPTLEDTWGLVTSEAMVLGKPVLCSQAAGSVELITDGFNGFQFDPQDPPQLASLMAQLIENPSLRETMGRHSAQSMAPYTPEGAAAFFEEVITFAIAPGKNPQR